MGEPSGRKVRKEEGHMGRAGKVRAKWQGYVNYTPNASDKEAFKRDMEEGYDVGAAIEECLHSGYKLSVAWDGYNSAICASLYCQVVGDPNAGWCLTARSTSTNNAIARVVWLHLIRLGGDWATAVEARRENENW